MADKFDPGVFLKDAIPSDPAKAPKKGKSGFHPIVASGHGTQKTRQAEMRSKTVPKAK